MQLSAVVDGYSRQRTSYSRTGSPTPFISCQASYAKLFAPPVVFRAVSSALDILGEAGMRSDRMLEMLYRDVTILDIGEGTRQVQRLVVARQLFGLPRDA